MSMSPISPAEYSCKEMNRNTELMERSNAFSRKSSMGISDDELYSATEHKISKRFATSKHIVEAARPKPTESMVAKIVQK